MPSISLTLVMVHHGNVFVNGSMSNVTFKFEGDRRVVIDQCVSFMNFIIFKTKLHKFTLVNAIADMK